MPADRHVADVRPKRSNLSLIRSPSNDAVFELMVLCAVRSAEARDATWDEVDVDAAT